MAPRIVTCVTCHNDFIYLRNLIPQLRKFSDRIIAVDDCSTDGSEEWLKYQNKVELVTRKFENNFADQRNASLDMVNDGDWVFRVDSDELPTTWIVNNLPYVLDYYDSNKCNRTAMSIYHLINPAMCKVQYGLEMRIFKKNSTCRYKGEMHEVMDGTFGEGFGQLHFPEQGGLVHFKYADKNLINYTEQYFIPNKLYQPEDWNRRKDLEATFLPSAINYEISEELRNHLEENTPCLKNISKIKE